MLEEIKIPDVEIRQDDVKFHSGQRFVFRIDQLSRKVLQSRSMAQIDRSHP
jgi:hypothetical protein